MYETKFIYEVFVWDNSENPQRPNAQFRFTSKAKALAKAKSLAKKYALVEVNKNEVDVNDENNMLGFDFVASWTNGIKTA